jgi:hypothetical protein
MYDLAQLKDLLLWHNWNQRKELSQPHFTNQFLSLTIDIFRYLHKQVHVFLHNCANVIWSLKKLRSPPFSIFVTFFIKNFNYITKDASKTPS